jgi:hypothetical protein
LLIAAVTGVRIDLGQAAPDRLALASLEARVDRLGQAVEGQSRHLVTVMGLAGLCLSLAVAMLALLLAPAGVLAGVNLAVAGLLALGLALLALTLWRSRAGGRGTAGDA